MQMDGISMLDPEEEEIARGLTPVPRALLGLVDLATLDALITAGIAASRAEAARWALARIREQPAYAQLSERAREPGEPRARTGLDRVVLDESQSRLGEQVRAHFPTAGCSGSRCSSTATTRQSSREAGAFGRDVCSTWASVKPALRMESSVGRLQSQLNRTEPLAERRRDRAAVHVHCR